MKLASEHYTYMMREEQSGVAEMNTSRTSAFSVLYLEGKEGTDSFCHS